MKFRLNLGWSHSQWRRLRLLFSIAVGLCSAVILGWNSTVQSQSLPPPNLWQSASFPVEQFQGYSSAFGYRRSPDGGTSQEFHRGLDIVAPEGSYIRNWWQGKVLDVSDDSSCGTSVTIESGDWQHVYCHMQGHVEQDQQGKYLLDRLGGIQLRPGQTLSAGDRLGRVGMTGRTTGPHLHWGLKYAGQLVDPALVLRAMYAGQGTEQQLSSNS